MDSPSVYKKVSLKLDLDRYAALRLLGFKRDLANQALLIEALDAFLARQRQGRQVHAIDAVHVVTGQAVDDEADRPCVWIESVWATAEAAQQRVAALEQFLRDAAAGLGAPADLVGLTALQRKTLQQAVRGQDAHVTVGRHGVRWSTESRPLS
jgi:hypothetical protein